MSVSKQAQLYKAGSFTDVHFGAKNNSDQHNQDCLNFISWFCEEVRNDSSIDHVIFIGDWYENRSALNISTMNYSYHGAKMLNDLGVPVFFIIGNHDLYHKHTRDVHSVVNFHEFSNFTIIDTPVMVPNIGAGAVLSPYLFHDEYPTLAKFLNYKTWWGHFEFKGFVITGYNVKMPTGPNPTDFKGPDRIFSGHFHKRQSQENIHYIGNTFPTNFGDAGDSDRGMAIYNHENNDLQFKNWDKAPHYVKATLSSLMEDNVIIPVGARVKCIVDIPVSYEESAIIKDGFFEQFQLREFALEESNSLSEILSDTLPDLTELELDMSSVDDLVLKMLGSIKSDDIDNELLIDQFKKLK